MRGKGSSGKEEDMYKFEKKIEDAEHRGIDFSEGQKTYLRCARINGIDILDHLYDEYSKEHANHPKTSDGEYLDIIGMIITVTEVFDKNMCELVDQMIEYNRSSDAGM